VPNHFGLIRTSTPSASRIFSTVLQHGFGFLDFSKRHRFARGIRTFRASWIAGISRASLRRLISFPMFMFVVALNLPFVQNHKTSLQEHRLVSEPFLGIRSKPNTDQRNIPRAVAGIHTAYGNMGIRAESASYILTGT
jgi:hypothetical protein